MIGLILAAPFAVIVLWIVGARLVSAVAPMARPVAEVMVH